MIKLSKEGIQKLQESYETMQILDSSDYLDEVRGILADEFPTFKPPEIRQQLLKLHDFAD